MKPKNARQLRVLSFENALLAKTFLQNRDEYISIVKTEREREMRAVTMIQQDGELWKTCVIGENFTESTL